MGFTKEERDRIKKYILEKIYNNEDVIEKTADTFKISLTTIYRYLNDLHKEGLIEKIPNEGARYKLTESSKSFSYSLEGRKLEEHEIYYEDIAPYIRELSHNVVNIWEYSFMEMMNNAIDHSEGKKISCLISQNYLYTTIVIRDDGVGIFQKIKNYYNYNTLDDAISELFKGKLTTDSKNHSGEGIFFTSRIMDMFGALSQGKIFTHDNHAECLEDLENIDSLKKWKDDKGTTIIMVMSNWSIKTVKEVFDMFSDNEGGFTRTQIPIKNVFENGYPVSRSQAKRLYHRFDKFKEVILDFEGVSMIGQGFAHELFVVFKNNHPQIELLVKNTSEDVEKMINHVLLSTVSE